MARIASGPTSGRMTETALAVQAQSKEDERLGRKMRADQYKQVADFKMQQIQQQEERQFAMERAVMELAGRSKMAREQQTRLSQQFAMTQSFRERSAREARAERGRQWEAQKVGVEAAAPVRWEEAEQRFVAVPAEEWGPARAAVAAKEGEQRARADRGRDAENTLQASYPDWAGDNPEALAAYSRDVATGAMTSGQAVLQVGRLVAREERDRAEAQERQRDEQAMVALAQSLIPLPKIPVVPQIGGIFAEEEFKRLKAQSPDREDEDIQNQIRYAMTDPSETAQFGYTPGAYDKELEERRKQWEVTQRGKSDLRAGRQLEARQLQQGYQNLVGRSSMLLAAGTTPGQTRTLLLGEISSLLRSSGMSDEEIQEAMTGKQPKEKPPKQMEDLYYEWGPDSGKTPEEREKFLLSPWAPMVAEEHGLTMEQLIPLVGGQMGAPGG